MRRFFAVVGLSLLLALHASRFTLHDSAYASIPWLINYQGRLTDSGGKAVTGTYTVIFRFYDAATSGNKVWEEQQTVTIADADNGLFNAVLGSVTPLTSMDFNSAYWLSVQVGSDTEMSPRQRLTSTGYAMNSATLNSLASTKFLRTDVDTSTSGKLTITRSGAALVITPSSDPAADTKLLDVQNAAGTSKFSVDLEGDTVVAGDLSVTGTMSGATSTTGTTNASWNIGSGTDATASNVSLLFGKSTGQKSLVFQGASTGDFIFSNNLRLDGQSALKLVASSGTNFVGLKAPSSIPTSVTWTLPSADGSANQLLGTNGSGTLSWLSAGSISGVGDITAVTAGTGLTGGGTSGDVTLTLSTPVSVANGGTGAATLTSNGVLYGSGTSAIAATSAGTTGTVLHGNTSAVPSFSAVSLTADVSGALPLANGGTNSSTLTNCTSGQALTVTSGAVACTSTITSNNAGSGTTSTTFTIDSSNTSGSAPNDGSGLIVRGGTGDVSATWDATNARLKINNDVVIDTATYQQNPTRGGLFIAQDPTASNSDGYIFLGRRSAKTGGWNSLRGSSSDGHLIWNGSELQVEGDSPASISFGASSDLTTRYALKFNPDVTPKTLSMIEIKNPGASQIETTLLELKAGGRLGLEFSNLVHNGSFEAFSALEKFKSAGYAGGAFQHGTTAATAFQGGWANFAPDEWNWVAGQIVQHSPSMLANVTASVTTDAAAGKSAVGIKDSLTTASYVTPGDGNDGAIKQTLKNLKPSMTYAVGVKAMVTNAGNSTALVDVTGADAAGQLTPVGQNTAGALSTTATSYTDLIGTFKTTASASEVTIYLLCRQTGSPVAGDMCRFDAVQVMAGKSVPEFAPNSLVDSGDQTLYGLLHVARTTDSAGGAGGGILAVDRYVRTRGVEFFQDDPGFTGSAGGTGTVGPPSPSVFNFSGAPGSLTLTAGGSFTGGMPVEYRVRINGIGNPNTFVWSRRNMPDGIFGSDSPSLSVSTSAQTLELGVTVTFNAVTGGVLNDEWRFNAMGMNMGAAYNSFSPTATYTPSEKRIFVNPVSGKLTFQEGNKQVTLDQITADIAQPSFVGAPTFSGSGYLSMMTLGTYSGTASRTYEVVIDTDNAAGSVTADKFKWRQLSNAVFTVVNVAIPQNDTAVTLEDGIQVKFFNSPSLKYNEAVLNDRWTFNVQPTTASAGKVSSIRAYDGVTDNKPQLSGAVRLVQGSNITLGQAGQDITITASLTGADGKDVKSSAGDSTANYLATELTGGTGISVLETGSGDTKTQVAIDTAVVPRLASTNIFTATTASPLLIRPSSGPVANTKLLDVQTSGTTTSVASISAEGNAILNSLSLTSALGVSSGGTGTTTSTGSVNLVLSNSPTLTTPTVNGNITYTGTQPKRTIVLTASGAIVPASNAPQQLQTNGTNLSFYTLNYSGTASSAQSAYWEFIVPDSYTGTTVNATLYWLTPSTTAGNVVKWFVDMNGLGNAQTLDAALQTAGTVTGNPTATANQVLVTTEITGITTGWSAGSYAVVRVQRNAADAADTETALAKLLSVKLKWTGSAESD